ncbi:hypothetical protein EJ08DRAFT_696692 [Tothia fuscella]|uniref:Uncharacterized protein n=1 Tax=Tothia fuscella TaxID=1048955 RepID=A0A9P4NSE9_9PEZI|nr:hypothetical protein EJ08DRAFT_696692 [Tothia fuscella]
MVNLSTLGLLALSSYAAAQGWGSQWGGGPRPTSAPGLSTPGAPWGTAPGGQNPVPLKPNPVPQNPNQGGGPPKGPQCIVSVIIYSTEVGAERRTRTRTRTEIKPSTVYTYTSVEVVETILGNNPEGVPTTRTRTRTRERPTSYVTTVETVETRTIIQDSDGGRPGGTQTLTTSITSCRN